MTKVTLGKNQKKFGSEFEIEFGIEMEIGEL